MGVESGSSGWGGNGRSPHLVLLTRPSRFFKNLFIFLQAFKKLWPWGAWVAQSVKRPTSASLEVLDREVGAVPHMLQTREELTYAHSD